MTKVTLNDGTVLQALGVHSEIKYYNGKARDTLTFLLPAEISVNQARALFTEANCENIILGEDVFDEENNQIDSAYPWSGYTMFLSAGTGAIADVIIGASEMESCTWIRMARLTDEELRIKELEARLAALEG